MSSSSQVTGFATLDGTAPSFRGEGLPVVFEGLCKRKDTKLGRYLFELRSHDAAALYNKFSRSHDDKTAFAVEDAYWKIPTAVGKLDRGNLDPAALKKLDSSLMSFVGKPVVLTITGAVYYYDDVTFKNGKKKDNDNAPSYSGYSLSITNVVPSASIAQEDIKKLQEDVTHGKKKPSKKVLAAPPVMKRTITRGASAILLSDDDTQQYSDDE